MIISIVTGPWLPVPALQGGSTSRIWQGLAEEFAHQGHQVTIYCRSYPGQPEREVIDGVRYLRKAGFPQSSSIIVDLLKDLAYSFLTLPSLPGQADILIINDFWLPVFAPFFRADAGRVVTHVGRFPKGQFFLYTKVARFVALSGVIRDAIASQFPPATSRIKVIPNPVDTRVFSPPPLPRCPTQDKTILYVGRIHPEKGLNLLIDAFNLISEQFPQTRLKIIGPFKENQGGGGEDYLNSLKSKVGNSQVEFSLPIFDVNQLADAYRRADLFCYPSIAEKGESFPVAPLEAMASGLIPIVSDLACFKDFIEADKTGYFFDHRGPGAVSNLADVLIYAIANWEKTRRIGNNATQKVQDFSYGKIAQQYLDDFELLVKMS